MEQMTMFEVKEKLDYSGLAMTLSFDQEEIIQNIMHLHNRDRPFDLDLTYSKGVFWKNLPKPRYKFDLIPEAKGVVCAKAQEIPLPSGSIESIMFDPPFVIKNQKRENATLGIIEKRFYGYPNKEKLFKFYKATIQDSYRVLKDDGILVVKCQDTMAGKQVWSHYWVMNFAFEAGFYCKDNFVLGRKSVIWSPNMINQRHARKNHSYFLVFEK